MPSAVLVAQAQRLIADGLPIGPSLEPCVCGAPRHTHRGRLRSGSHQPTGCRRYRREPADALVEKVLRAAERSLGQDMRAFDAARPRPGRQSRDGWGVSASDTTSCRKAIEYRERPPADYTPVWMPKTEAMAGTLLHESALRRRRALYPWRRYEQQVRLPGLDVPSHFDEYDPLTGILYDLKTAGEYKWDLIGRSGPPEAEWEQAALYALALHLAGERVQEIRIVCLEREKGRDEEFRRPFDESFARRALAKLTSIAAALDAGLELPRDRSGPSTDPVCARYCPARLHCWGITQATAAGRSPESYTLVRTDADTERAVADYDRHRGDKTRADARQKVQRALLEGLPAGRYGSFELKYKGGNLKDPEPDSQSRITQLEGFFDLPDGQRPALTDLEFPTTRRRSPRAIDVRRVRAAQLEKERRATGQ